MKRHNKALGKLAKAKEKWYESQVEKKNRIAILRQELADAKSDMEVTNHALDSLRKAQEELTLDKEPTIHDYYKPSSEMEEYQQITIGILGVGTTHTINGLPPTLTPTSARPEVERIVNGVEVNISGEYEKMREKILESLAKFQKNGSGWRLHKVEKLEVSVTKYEPLKGKGYTTPLPKPLKGKNAIIYIKNEDNQCFKWAVTRALNPAKRDACRVTKILKLQTEKYNWKDIEFPTKVKDIHKWEEKNNININVFGYDEETKKLYTLKLGEQENPTETRHNLARLNTQHYNQWIMWKNRNEDIGKMFIDSLQENLKPVYEILKKVTPISMTEKDEKNYTESDNCYACGIQFGTRSLSYHWQISRSRMRQILGLSEGDINCIPKTDEKYISFSKKIPMETIILPDGEKTLYLEMRFIDSYKFTLASLDSLANTLGEDDFRTLESQMKHSGIELLKRKGVFPYEFMTGYDKLQYDKLPSKKEFYSKLNNTDINDEDYEHAQKVWKTFDCKTMRDYHDLYLKTDVLLLTDVMYRFRKICMENYGLDPLHYYTAPGLAWDAALKITKIELELIHNPNMYLMIEKGIRGGVSTIMKRYAKANNKYMKNYDPKKDNIYTPYLDANNLYGWAMSQPLPVRNFKWMTETELSNWENIPCILEVDLEYPENLHDIHNEYPLAPESIEVNKVKKLIPNLNDKKNYVLHYRNLKLYLKLGLKLTKVHRGVKFEESPWLAKYIQLNTNLRTKGTTDFEKNFFKLMNNSVFGKTMENVRNRVNVKLVTTEEQLNKLAKKSYFKGVNIFTENLIAVHMEKTTVKLVKPIYLGMSILDLSKTLMYNFHYNYIKPKYGNNANLLFTDTDSLRYEIKTEDFYKDITPDVEKWFDTSNYDKDHSSGIPVGKNKKVVGMMKDECGGKQISEFVGLRSKLYAYKMDEGEEEKKCKGVKKCVVKNEIVFEDYKNCLFSGTEQHRTMNTFRSRQHEITTERINKTALSANDNKRVHPGSQPSVLPRRSYASPRIPKATALKSPPTTTDVILYLSIIFGMYPLSLRYPMGHRAASVRMDSNKVTIDPSPLSSVSVLLSQNQKYLMTTFDSSQKREDNKVQLDFNCPEKINQIARMCKYTDYKDDGWEKALKFGVLITFTELEGPEGRIHLGTPTDIINNLFRMCMSWEEWVRLIKVASKKEHFSYVRFLMEFTKQNAPISDKKFESIERMRTNVLEKARERGLKIEKKINNNFDELLKKEKRKIIGKEVNQQWKSDIAKEEKRRRKEVTDWKAEGQKCKKETQRLRRNAKARERRAEENRRIAEGKWKGKKKFARFQLKPNTPSRKSLRN
ncbi:Hypothetical predicted protein, partial [Paramuricea clavata]